MERVTERLTLVVTLLSAGGLFSVLWQFRSLRAAIRVRGLGRIFYLSLLAFVVWVSLVMAYFLLNTLVPDSFGLLNSQRRDLIRLFFRVYLLVLVTTINAAIYHWRREDWRR